jgi:hypothetical protein
MLFKYLSKKIFLVFIFTVCFLISVLFLKCITIYPGSKLVYLSFSFIFNLILYYSLFKKPLFIETFFGVFLWLGFWFKFSLQTAFLGNIFAEGTGDFDFSGSSYDKVLIVSTLASLGFFIGFKIFKINFYFYYRKSNNYPKNIFIRYYNENTYKIIFFLILFILFIGLSNFFFGIYQKGLTAETVLPLGLNNIYKVLLLFGLTYIVTLLISTVFFYKRKKLLFVFFLLIFETFITNISMLSRGMLFNFLAVLWGIFITNKFYQIKNNSIFYAKVFLIFIFFYFINILSVGYLREYKNFPQVHGEAQSFIPLPSISDNSDKKLSKLTFDMAKKINQVIFLATNRWVGIDAVMSVTSSNKLGYQIFFDSWKDNYSRFVYGFYERNFQIRDPIYYNIINGEPKERNYGVLLPGIIAFLFYPGSYYFLFLMSFSIALIICFMEWSFFLLSRKNLLTTSLLSFLIAYRLCHFGYLPNQTYLLVTSMYAFLLFVLFFRFLFIKYLLK